MVRVFRLSFVSFFLVHAPLSAQTVQSVQVGSGFSAPVFATSAPGDPGNLYVVEQGGLIKSLNPSTGTVGSTLLDMASVAGTNFISGGEQGLLGLAFHPNFQNNGFVYVNYTATSPTTDYLNRIDRFTVTGGVVDTSTRQTVIEIPHPTNQNHHAGWIGFNPMNGATGPNSGQLYIGTGDGGGGNDIPNNAQNTNVLLGKMLRLDVNNPSGGNNYGIPAGNMPGAGVRPEIYSYGLRNPYRASFDRGTGNLYIGDVGQGTREEVDFIAHGSPGGQNFGWRLREGTVQTPTVGGPPPPGNVEPIHDYGRDQGSTVVGGYVYRGPNAQLNGTYFFGDYGSGKVWSFRYDGTTMTEFTDRTVELHTAINGGGVLSNPASFAEDGFGNLYMIDYGGAIFQISPVPEPATLGLAAGLAAVGVRRWTRRRSAG